MNTSSTKMNDHIEGEVFKPNLWPNLWVFAIWGLLAAYVFISGAMDGHYRWSNLIWIIISVLMVVFAISDYRTDRWIVAGDVLANRVSKKEPLITYDINKIKSVTLKKPAWIKFPWSRVVVKIQFVDRSQTKSIEPLSVDVKNYQSFVEALVEANKNIEVIK